MGAGALIIREGAPFGSLSAGAQENHRRGGTENVAAIAGFGAAARAARDGSTGKLRDQFEAGLKKLAPDAVVFAQRAERLPNVSNFAIPGLTAETALIALDLDGIALSSGAACSSGKVRPSHVLAAMGVPENLARSGLRLSLGWNNTEHDVVATLVALERLLRRKGERGAVAA
jgi:cysteine desulfurase